MSTRPPLRIAIDSGGTFTDCVWLQDSTLQILKVFSTPSDPSKSIADAVSKIAGDVQEIVVLHGTTVGTNTLLQRKGARVAFVTTKGFEDSIEIGRQQRPKLYDFFFEKDPALAPAELRSGVDERTSAEGKILRAASAASLRTLAEQIAAQKPQAIARSLLFSFANPENEKAVVAALAGLNLPLSVSHQILPEFREYERASTVLVNAYLQPIMQKYLEKLQERLSSGNPTLSQKARKDGVPAEPLSHARAPALHGLRSSLAQARVPVQNKQARIFVMQSSGGIT